MSSPSLPPLRLALLDNKRGRQLYNYRPSQRKEYGANYDLILTYVFQLHDEAHLQAAHQVRAQNDANRRNVGLYSVQPSNDLIILVRSARAVTSPTAARGKGKERAEGK
jgi:hypothetical protein